MGRGMTTYVHTLNWTCLLVPAGTLPVDDGPECQACRIQVTREALAVACTACDWRSLPLNESYPGDGKCPRCGEPVAP